MFHLKLFIFDQLGSRYVRVWAVAAVSLYQLMICSTDHCSHWHDCYNYVKMFWLHKSSHWGLAFGWTVHYVTCLGAVSLYQLIMICSTDKCSHWHVKMFLLHKSSHWGLAFGWTVHYVMCLGRVWQWPRLAGTMGSVRPDGGGEAGNHLGEEGEARFWKVRPDFGLFSVSRGISWQASSQLGGSKWHLFLLSFQPECVASTFK